MERTYSNSARFIVLAGRGRAYRSLNKVIARQGGYHVLRQRIDGAAVLDDAAGRDEGDVPAPRLGDALLGPAALEPAAEPVAVVAVQAGGLGFVDEPGAGNGSSGEGRGRNEVQRRRRPAGGWPKGLSPRLTVERAAQSRSLGELSEPPGRHRPEGRPRTTRTWC